MDGTIRVWRQEISNTQSSSSNTSTPVPFTLSPNRTSQRDLEALEGEEQQLSVSSVKEDNSKKSSWLCEHTVESDGPVVSPFKLSLFPSLFPSLYLSLRLSLPHSYSPPFKYIIMLYLWGRNPNPTVFSASSSLNYCLVQCHRKMCVFADRKLECVCTLHVCDCAVFISETVCSSIQFDYLYYLGAWSPSLYLALTVLKPRDLHFLSIFKRN